eukprot:s2891_g8.t1
MATMNVSPHPNGADCQEFDCPDRQPRGASGPPRDGQQPAQQPAPCGAQQPLLGMSCTFAGCDAPDAEAFFRVLVKLEPLLRHLSPGAVPESCWTQLRRILAERPAQMGEEAAEAVKEMEQVPASELAELSATFQKLHRITTELSRPVQSMDEVLLPLRQAAQILLRPQAHGPLRGFLRRLRLRRGAKENMVPQCKTGRLQKPPADDYACAREQAADEGLVGAFPSSLFGPLRRLLDGPAPVQRGAAEVVAACARACGAPLLRGLLSLAPLLLKVASFRGPAQGSARAALAEMSSQSWSGFRATWRALMQAILASSGSRRSPGLSGMVDQGSGQLLEVFRALEEVWPQLAETSDAAAARQALGELLAVAAPCCLHSSSQLRTAAARALRGAAAACGAEAVEEELNAAPASIAAIGAARAALQATEPGPAPIRSAPSAARSSPLIPDCAVRAEATPGPSRPRRLNFSPKPTERGERSVQRSRRSKSLVPCQDICDTTDQHQDSEALEPLKRHCQLGEVSEAIQLFDNLEKQAQEDGNRQLLSVLHGPALASLREISRRRAGFIERLVEPAWKDHSEWTFLNLSDPEIDPNFKLTFRTRIMIGAHATGFPVNLTQLVAYHSRVDHIKKEWIKDCEKIYGKPASNQNLYTAILASLMAPRVLPFKLEDTSVILAERTQKPDKIIRNFVLCKEAPPIPGSRPGVMVMESSPDDALTHYDGLELPAPRRGVIQITGSEKLNYFMPSLVGPNHIDAISSLRAQLPVPQISTYWEKADYADQSDLRRLAAPVASWIAYGPPGRIPTVEEFQLVTKFMNKMDGGLLPSRLRDVLCEMERRLQSLPRQADDSWNKAEKRLQKSCRKLHRRCNETVADETVVAADAGIADAELRAEQDAEEAARRSRKSLSEEELADVLNTVAACLAAPRRHARLNEADARGVGEGKAALESQDPTADLQKRIRSLFLYALHVWQMNHFDCQAIEHILDCVHQKISKFENNFGEIQGAAAGKAWLKLKQIVAELQLRVEATWNPHAKGATKTQAEAARKVGVRQERQSGIQNIRWNAGRLGWECQRSYGKGVSRRQTSRWFPISRFLQEGLGEEAAVEAALQQAKAFREELVRQGKLKPPKPKPPRSTVRGVKFDKTNQKWRVQLYHPVDDKLVHYGSFHAKEEAEVKAREMARQLGVHAEYEADVFTNTLKTIKDQVCSNWDDLPFNAEIEADPAFFGQLQEIIDASTAELCKQTL